MKQIRINGFQMAYEKIGKGASPIVLIHGNLASKRWWDPIKTELSKQYSLYMIDLRGCGQSEAPNDGYTIEQYSKDVISFLVELQIPQVTIIGHSMGGAVAMKVASIIPNQIQSLILLNSAPVSGFQMTEDKLRLVETYAMDRNLLKMSLGATMPTAADQPIFEVLFEDAWKASKTAIWNSRSLSSFNLTDWARKFDKPVLVLYGKKDHLISLEAMEEMKNLFSHCLLEIHQEVGHSPQIEDTNWFLEKTRGFLVQLGL